MYPHPKKKHRAMAKQGMQLARDLIGDDTDAPLLLEIAKQVTFTFYVLIILTYFKKTNI